MRQTFLIEFGQRLSAARKAHGLTGSDVGSRLDPPVGKGTVSTWEVGRATPDPYTIAQIAAIYSTSTDALITGADRWPFSPDLLGQVLALNDRELLQLEGAMRLALAQIRPLEGRKQTAA